MEKFFAMMGAVVHEFDDKPIYVAGKQKVKILDDLLRRRMRR